MKHADPLNPTAPAYIFDSPEEKLVVNVARSSVFIGVVGLVVIGLSFWHSWHIKLVVSILAGPRSLPCGSRMSTFSCTEGQVCPEALSYLSKVSK